MKAQVHEFRVVWKREGDSNVRRRIYQLEHAARRFMRRLSLKTWEVRSEESGRTCGPDSLVCCGGSECGCRGQTLGQLQAEQDDAWAPLEYVRIQRRAVTEWETTT